MTGKSAAKPTTGIELSTIGNVYLSISEISWLSCRFVGVFVSIMTLSTVTIMGNMISAIWRETVTSRTIPFSFCMARRSAVACDAIVSYAAQFDGTRIPVQIVLIVAVAVLTLEILLAHMGFVRACIWRVSMTVGAVRSPDTRFVAGSPTARSIAGIVLAGTSNTYLSIGEIFRLNRRLI